MLQGIRSRSLNAARGGSPGRYRHLSHTERLVDLNHAAGAALSKPAANAMKQLADDVCLHCALHYDQWLDAYAGIRVMEVAQQHVANHVLCRIQGGGIEHYDTFVTYIRILINPRANQKYAEFQRVGSGNAGEIIAPHKRRLRTANLTT